MDAAPKSSSPGAGVEPEWPQDCHTIFVGVPCACSDLYVATASCRLNRVSFWPCTIRVGALTFFAYVDTDAGRANAKVASSGKPAVLSWAAAGQTSVRKFGHPAMVSGSTVALCAPDTMPSPKKRAIHSFLATPGVREVTPLLRSVLFGASE